ncbi:50S ribosomal protein L35 [Candidatus Peregrinibacteria bacterium]|nr:50S ribosomal protein L35 [Candidatus Peregrinibacteria bacterium]
MKLKSHSGLKKRVKISGRGKIMFQKPGKRHLLINKSKRQKATHNMGMPSHGSDVSKIKRLLPQSF